MKEISPMELIISMDTQAYQELDKDPSYLLFLKYLHTKSDPELLSRFTRNPNKYLMPLVLDFGYWLVAERGKDE